MYKLVHNILTLYVSCTFFEEWRVLWPPAGCQLAGQAHQAENQPWWVLIFLLVLYMMECFEKGNIVLEIIFFNLCFSYNLYVMIFCTLALALFLLSGYLALFLLLCYPPFPVIWLPGIVTVIRLTIRVPVFLFPSLVPVVLLPSLVPVIWWPSFVPVIWLPISFPVIWLPGLFTVIWLPGLVTVIRLTSPVHVILIPSHVPVICIVLLSPCSWYLVSLENVCLNFWLPCPSRRRLCSGCCSCGCWQAGRQVGYGRKRSPKARRMSLKTN